jgi:hypothetical protein
MARSPRPQTYANHQHRPYPTYIVAVFAVAGIFMLANQWWHTGDPRTLATLFIGIAVVILGSMSRTYTVTLQNRIIRLEMRLRLKDVLPATQQGQIADLTLPQLVALRFASDEELPSLVDRAVREKLSREDIKKAVRNWVADWDRT